MITTAALQLVVKLERVEEYSSLQHTLQPKLEM